MILKDSNSEEIKGNEGERDMSSQIQTWEVAVHGKHLNHGHHLDWAFKAAAPKSFSLAPNISPLERFVTKEDNSVVILYIQ